MSHLVPFCAAGASSCKFPFLLDVLHLHEYTCLWYFTRPPFDSTELPSAEERVGDLLLVGAEMEDADEGIGMYRIHVPNHTYFLKPSSPQQNEVVLLNMRKWLSVANTPYLNSKIMFVCLRINIVGETDPSAPSPTECQTAPSAASPVGTDDPAKSCGSFVDSSIVQSQDVKGVYVEFPVLRDVARAKGTSRVQQLPTAGTDGNMGGINMPTLSFYEKLPIVKTHCLVVLPFEVASPQTVSFGVEHAVYGKLSPFLGASPLSLNQLIGAHGSPESAFVMRLTDTAGKVTRCNLSIWWRPPTNAYFKLDFAAQGLFRRGYVFSDPYLRLSILENESRKGKAAQPAYETLYRSEAYRNCHSPTFLTMPLSLPPTYGQCNEIGEASPDSAKDATWRKEVLETLTIFNVFAELRKLWREEQLRRRGCEPARKGPSLAAFVPPRINWEKTARAPLRPSSAPVSRKALPRASFSVTSPFFPPTTLPDVVMDPSDTLCSRWAMAQEEQQEEASGYGYLDNSRPFPVVLLQDQLECTVVDSNYDPSTRTSRPAAIGSFKFCLSDALSAHSGALPSVPMNINLLTRREEAAKKGVQDSGIAFVIRPSPYSHPIREQPAYRLLAPSAPQQSNSQFTLAAAKKHVSCPRVTLKSLSLHERYTFQHFLASGWELASYIVVDFSPSSQTSHRTACFANGWCAFQGLIAAINQSVVPQMHRQGSDLYGAGITLPEMQYGVYPLFRFADVFGVAVEEMQSHFSSAAHLAARSSAKSSDETSTPNPSSCDETTNEACEGAPTEAVDPFPAIRDWTGEQTLKLYEARRVLSTRTGGAALPFFLVPVIRRLTLRCGALQRSRQALLQKKKTVTGIPSQLIHAVFVLIGSYIADINEAMELLQQTAASHPICFVLVFVDGTTPAGFEHLPNVISVDFRSKTYVDLHRSLAMLQKAISLLPECFLAYARLHGIAPDSTAIRERNDTFFREVAAAKRRASELGIHLKEPIANASNELDPADSQDRFETAAIKFQRLFGARSVTHNNDDHRVVSEAAAPAQDFIKDADIEHFAGAGGMDDAVTQHFERATIKAQRPQSANVIGLPNKPPDDDVMMTVVDLFMNDEQALQKEQELRSLAALGAVAKSMDALQALMLKRHMKQMRKDAKSLQNENENEDGELTASPTSAHSPDEDESDVELEVLSTKQEKNVRHWRVRVGDSSAKKVGAPAAAPRTITTAGGSERVRQKQEEAALAEAMQFLKSRGGTFPSEEVSQRFRYTIPAPPKMKHEERFVAYKRAGRDLATIFPHHVNWRNATRDAIQRATQPTVCPATDSHYVFHDISPAKAAALQALLDQSTKVARGGPPLEREGGPDPRTARKAGPRRAKVAGFAPHSPEIANRAKRRS